MRRRDLGSVQGAWEPPLGQSKDLGGWGGAAGRSGASLLTMRDDLNIVPRHKVPGRRGKSLIPPTSQCAVGGSGREPAAEHWPAIAGPAPKTPLMVGWPTLLGPLSKGQDSTHQIALNL